MRSPTKGAASLMAGRFLTWKTLAYVTIFLIFLLEWKRYNNQQQSQINVPSISDQLILEQDILNFNDDDGGDWHKGRQLLKKPNRFGGSSGASTTSMNEPETEVKAGGSSRVPAYDDDDKNFGESVSLAHWMDERQKVYKARQRRVETICQKFNVATFSSNDTMEDLINQSVHNDSASGRYVERLKTDQFLLSRANQLMGCLINKVASSSMMRMYLTLQGLDTKKIESPHGYRLKFVPENEKEMKFSQDHFFKFMLVRHPMERLVSCYFDKMVNGTHKSLKGFRKFVKTRASNIREERRSKGIYANGVYNPNPTLDDRPLGSYPLSNPWSGFEPMPMKKKKVKKKKRPKRNINADASSASMSSKINPKMNSTSPNHINRTKEEPMVIPTLDDFFEFILTDQSGKGFSSHWVPYWKMCTPCHFNYDMIGKLETGFDDLTYLWKKTQLDSKAPIPWAHAGLSTDQEEERHLKKMKSFYSKVPRETLMRIYHAYKLDFELFDYDFNQVLLLAGYDPLPKL